MNFTNACGSIWEGDTELFFPLPTFTVQLAGLRTKFRKFDIYQIIFPTFLIAVKKSDISEQLSISATLKTNTVDITTQIAPSQICGFSVIRSFTITIMVREQISSSLIKGDKLTIIVGQELPVINTTQGKIRTYTQLSRSKSQGISS